TQVGGIIVQARLLEDLKSKEKERRDYRRRMVAAIKRLQACEKTGEHAEGVAAAGRARLNGLPGAPGFAPGLSRRPAPHCTAELSEDGQAESPDEEKGRFRSEMKESGAEIETLKARLSERMPEFDPAIIDAHRLMLHDRGFVGKVEAAIDDGLVAEAALRHVVEEYIG